MDVKQYVIKVYSHIYGKWLLHLLFWLLIFGARYYIGMISLNPFKNYGKGIVLVSFYATIISACAYYSLVYFIYEQLFKKRKYVAAVFAFLIWSIAYTGTDLCSELLMLENKTWKQLMIKHNPDYYHYLQKDFTNILVSRISTLGIFYQLFLSLSFPLLIKIVIAYAREQVQSAELARQNIQLEFNFLKSQVNPHFLFNTLNNIYSLILHDKKEQSADIVARLSAVMRYSLHEAASDKTAADKEIQLMTDYIELEKIRLNYIRVDTAFKTDRTNHFLPPLLFMPMLENAFKFCADEKEAFINLHMSIENNVLTFRCSNSLNTAIVNDKKGGIGLSNTLKRLDQHYPGKHIYWASKEDAVYSVSVKIQLL